MYEFNRRLIFVKTKGVKIYIGNRRITPEPTIVWWFPSNWIVVPAIILFGLPILAFKHFKNKLKDK